MASSWIFVKKSVDLVRQQEFCSAQSTCKRLVFGFRGWIADRSGVSAFALQSLLQVKGFWMGNAQEWGKASADNTIE